MTKHLFAAATISAVLTTGTLLRAEGPPEIPPHHLAPPGKVTLKMPKPVKVTHTEELSRKGFTKMEKYCCGIKLKANYVRVVYKTYYSNGKFEIWQKEYRAGGA